MSPGDGSSRLPELRLEQVENGDLVRQCFVDRPSGCGERRASQSVTAGEHEKPCKWIANVECRIGSAGDYIAMAVQKQCPVPVCRHLNQKSRAVRQGPSNNTWLRP